MSPSQIYIKRCLLGLVCIFSFLFVGAQTEYNYAVQLADIGLLKKATAVIDKVIEKEPPRALYYIQKASFHAQLRELDALEATLSKAIKLMPDSMDLLVLRAEYYQAIGRSKAAIIDYDKAIKASDKKPVKTALLWSSAKLKMEMGIMDLAYKDLRMALDYQPTNLNVLNSLEEICSKMGRKREKNKYTQKIQDLNPEVAVVRY